VAKYITRRKVEGIEAPVVQPMQPSLAVCTEKMHLYRLMKPIPVFVKNWNAFTPLGEHIDLLFPAMTEGLSGVKSTDFRFAEPAWASFFDHEDYLIGGFTRLESMIIRCLNPILERETSESERTVFIFSSTKGNIDLLSSTGQIPDASFLWHTAAKIARHYGNANRAVTVSTACISGVLAQNLGFDYIRSGKYDHAVVFGADLLTPFVISGFGSFKALASGPCRPYDVSRSGINLGEGAGALLLSKNPGSFPVRITGTGCSNDANHISGPSRTGDGLLLAIRQAIREAGVTPEEIDYLGAHGTATPYNDEMESLAFYEAGLSQVPLNSLKGFIGHTLGAAGIIESAVLLESLKRGELLPSPGYETHGVTRPLYIIRNHTKKAIKKALKTASGFGGSNAATIFETGTD
jgi:3-oxoacyl-[acyl-carrier-protein] synthase-1